MKSISKEEFKYLGFASLFAFVLFVLIIPNILTQINGMNPFILFAIFNIGIFVFLNIFLKSFSNNKKFNLKYSIGLILIVMALDILIPPLMVTPNGTLEDSPILSASASDFIFGLLAIKIGMTGFLVYLFTYVIVPFLLFLLSAFLLKNFTKDV